MREGRPGLPRRKLQQNGVYKTHETKRKRPKNNSSTNVQTPRQSSLKSISISLRSVGSDRNSVLLNNQTPSRQNSVKSRQSPEQHSPRRSAVKKNDIAPAPQTPVENGEIQSSSEIKIKKVGTKLNGKAIANNVDSSSINPRSLSDNHARALGTAVAMLLPISLAVVIIGLATPFWIRHKDSNVGIFQNCESWQSQCTIVSSSLISTSQFMTETWQLVKALQIAGCILVVLSLILTCGYLARRKKDNWKLANGIVASVLIHAGGSPLISSTVFLFYKSKLQDQEMTFGWSFYLNAVGSSMTLLTGIIFIVHLVLVFRSHCCRSRKRPQMVLCYTTDQWQNGNLKVGSSLECV